MKTPARDGSVTRPQNPHADEASWTWVSLVWAGRGLAVLCARKGKAGAGLIPRLSPWPHRRLSRHTLAPGRALAVGAHSSVTVSRGGVTDRSPGGLCTALSLQTGAGWPTTARVGRTQLCHREHRLVAVRSPRGPRSGGQ